VSRFPVSRSRLQAQAPVPCASFSLCPQFPGLCSCAQALPQPVLQAPGSCLCLRSGSGPGSRLRLQAPGSRPRLQPCAPFQVLQGSRLQGSHAPAQAPLSEHPVCTPVPGSRLLCPLPLSSVLASSRLQAPCSRLCSRLQAPGSRPGPGSLLCLQDPGSGNPGSSSRLCAPGFSRLHKTVLCVPGSGLFVARLQLQALCCAQSVRLQACTPYCAPVSLFLSPRLQFQVCPPGPGSGSSSRLLAPQAPGSVPVLQRFTCSGSSVIQATCGSRLQAPCAGVPCSVSVPAHCSQAPAQACSSVPVPVPVLRLCAQCSVSVLCALVFVPLFVLCALCSVRVIVALITARHVGPCLSVRLCRPSWVPPLCRPFCSPSASSCRPLCLTVYRKVIY
jgi:hypothetical protein